MDKYRDLWVPEGDTKTAPANYKEWEEKGQVIVDLCSGHNTVVQAGGNLGYFAIKLAKHFANVLTFEPMPDTWECMIKNITELSDAGDNIISVNQALGAVEGTARADYVKPDNCGATRLAMNDAGDLDVTTIDKVMGFSNLGSCDLIWLDIEGFEVEALKGAATTIREFNPVIVLENKGLIPGYGGNLHGAKLVDDWLRKEFGYSKHSRMMRDDIYVPA